MSWWVFWSLVDEFLFFRFAPEHELQSSAKIYVIQIPTKNFKDEYRTSDQAEKWATMLFKDAVGFRLINVEKKVCAKRVDRAQQYLPRVAHCC